MVYNQSGGLSFFKCAAVCVHRGVCVCACFLVNQLSDGWLMAGRKWAQWKTNARRQEGDGRDKGDDSRGVRESRVHETWDQPGGVRGGVCVAGKGCCRGSVPRGRAALSVCFLRSGNGTSSPSLTGCPKNAEQKINIKGLRRLRNAIRRSMHSFKRDGSDVSTRPRPFGACLVGLFVSFFFFFSLSFSLTAAPGSRAAAAGCLKPRC